MIEPVGSTRFPCEEIPRHRKKAAKKTPKKADHKHEYEPVVLSYINRNAFFSGERGFVPARDWAAGRRCILCGRLEHGFPDGSHPQVSARVDIPWANGTTKRTIIRKVEFAGLPEIRVKDYFKLEEEKIYG